MPEIKAKKNIPLYSLESNELLVDFNWKIESMNDSMDTL